MLHYFQKQLGYDFTNTYTTSGFSINFGGEEIEIPHFSKNISLVKTCHSNIYGGLPRWHSGKEPACQCKRRRFDPCVRKIHWNRKWQTTPVFLSGKFHEQRSLASYSSWDCKEWDMTDHTYFMNRTNMSWVI